jgi:hypothetical protein
MKSLTAADNITNTNNSNPAAAVTVDIVVVMAVRRSRIAC